MGTRTGKSARVDLLNGKPPPLETGDRLTRDEFMRRYEAMPHLKKAELINGVVYVPSPVRLIQHGGPHADLVTWLGTYRANTNRILSGWLGVYEAATPGVIGADNATTSWICAMCPNRTRCC